MAQEVERVGFIGLGDMGLPMAKCVLNKGYDVTVCGHVRREPVEEMRKSGAKEAKTPKEVAQGSDVTITVVRDDVDTGEVVLGNNGVLEGAKEGSGIIMMSTLSPAFCRRVGEAARTKGIGVLDAPVTGARMRAETGELAVCVGGDKELVKKYRPVIETMGSITYCGDLGMGQIVKLANNMVVIGISQATAEAISWGIKNGASEELLIDLMKQGTASNFVVQNWQYVKPMWTDPPPAVYWLGLKDLSIALRIGDEIGQPSPVAALVHELQKAGPPKLPEAQGS
jgi:3-hydroxyisobutyrate dehydrogenase-like beta-hydroxyacid dehydrogenase